MKERTMRAISTVLLLAAVAAPSSLVLPADAQTSEPLRSPDSFVSIADRRARSRAIFGEVARVLTGPRCMNCHPAGDHPLQGSDHHIHEPAAWRGPNDSGVPGLPCASCHTDRNFTLPTGEANYRSIPGHPRWGLAPAELAWERKSVGEICQQIKDPTRNGGRNLPLLKDHIANDDLVGWAWHPGGGRQPAPGTQKQLGDLVQMWIDTGADCP
jgi:hypothetical protein